MPTVRRRDVKHRSEMLPQLVELLSRPFKHVLLRPRLPSQDATHHHSQRRRNTAMVPQGYAPPTAPTVSDTFF